MENNGCISSSSASSFSMIRYAFFRLFQPSPPTHCVYVFLLLSTALRFWASLHQDHFHSSRIYSCWYILFCTVWFVHAHSNSAKKEIFNEFTCISWTNSKRMFLQKCTNCSNCSRWYTSDDQIAIFWNKYWEWFLGICRWLFCKSLYQWRDTLVD